MPNTTGQSIGPWVPFPFSVYDVFGYVVPGITFLLGLLAFETWAQHCTNGEFCTFLSPMLVALVPEVQEPSWVQATLFLVCAACVVYVVGHVISSISSLLIDRILVFRGHGYPYESALGIRTDWHKDSRVSRMAIQAGFLSFVGLQVIGYAMHFFDVGSHAACWLHPMGLVSLAPLLAIVLHVAGTLLLWASAAYCLVSVLIVVGELRWLRKYFRVLKKGRELSRRRIKYEYRVVRPVLIPLLAANSVIARLLHKRTGFRFDSKFIEHYGRLYKDLFGLDYRKADTNNYWLCSFYVAQRAPFLFRQQLNWLHLYSFARNLSIALYLDFLYCCAVLTYNDPFLPSASCCDAAATLLRSLPLLYFFVSLMLLLRYYYLYSCYYTRHLLRAFVYLGSPASQVEFPSGGSQAPSD